MPPKKRGSGRRSTTKRSSKKAPEKEPVKIVVKVEEDEEEMTTLDEVSTTTITNMNNSNAAASSNGHHNDHDVDETNNQSLQDHEDNANKTIPATDDDFPNDDEEEEMEIKDELKEDDNKKSSSINNKSTPKSNKNDKKSSTKKRENSDEVSSSTSSNKKAKSSSNSSDSKSKSNENNKHKNDKKESKSESTKKPSDTDKDKDYDEAYFKRMHRRGQDKFHDPTDKELFIENLINNIKGKEMKLCAHRHSSACIVWLFENVKDFSVMKKIADNILSEKFTIDFVFNDNCCSVLEGIFDEFIKLLAREENFETENSKYIIKWLDNVAKFVSDNVSSMITNGTERGNHLLLMTLEALGGILIGRYWNRKKMRFGSGIKVDLEAIISPDLAFKREIPQQFKHHLKKITKTLILDNNDENIRETMFMQCTNVAQYLLLILKVRYSDLCQMVVKKLVEIVFANDSNRDSICQSANGAYIVEILLLVASESRLSKIWTKHIKPNLKNFWKHEISHFIIQRLIDAIKEENLYADVVQHIFPDLADMFKCNRPGIGVCLAKTCLDHPKIQSSCLFALMKAFECHEPKEKQLDLVPQILFYECKFFNKTSPKKINNLSIWLHGSLMLQHLLNFKDPYKVSKSLLSMSTADLIHTCQDRSGSHVIDSFLKSSTVELKHKSELVERFLGNYCRLSCDKSGSRIVENIMNLSNQEVRATIVEELCQNEDKLLRNQNGWFVAKNVGLHHFKNRHNDWKDVERNRMKRKREFDDFIHFKSKGGPKGRGDGHRGGDRWEWRKRNRGGKSFSK